jgi:hypothetical protein
VSTALEARPRITTEEAEQRVVQLMRTLSEARVSYGLGSTGEGVTLMPSQYHEGSYSELERRLRELRESSRRRLWWHSSQRYRWGVERVIVAPVVRRKAGPEFRLPPFCELIAGGPAVGSKKAIARVYSWREDVDEDAAAEGITALAELMYDGEYDRIVLPMLVLRRVLGIPEPEAVAV